MVGKSVRSFYTGTSRYHSYNLQPQQPHTNIIFKQKLLSFVMSVILAIVLEQSLFDQVQYAVSEVCQKFVWTMVTQRLEMFLSGRWFQSG